MDDFLSILKKWAENNKTKQCLQRQKENGFHAEGAAWVTGNEVAHGNECEYNVRKEALTRPLKSKIARTF